jgi:fused signal recognition particle receptor
MERFKRLLGGKTLEQGAARTREGPFAALRALFQTGARLDGAFWEELEFTLISADVGPYLTAELVAAARERLKGLRLEDAFQARQVVQLLLSERLTVGSSLLSHVVPLTVVLLVGVNGSGKTTSIAKLAHWLTQQGYSCLLAAADTFRAAAIDQLQTWGHRAGVPVIAQQPGSDPGAVVYDALESALARKLDYLLVDTAGRLQTKTNLMEELRKIRRIVANKVGEQAIETLLVLDAITGQNALSQAKAFTQAAGVTGLILTKLDSTAKGGSVFAIVNELRVPIKFVGTGEHLDDIDVFDAKRFVAALFAEPAAV